MTSDWRRYAVAMVDHLTRGGQLTDERWKDAFRGIPRHLFVPGHELGEAYGSDAIVTQTRAATVVGGGSVDLPTSSASAPGSVAVMLDRLAIEDGQRVLEIGTGTGYNTALLCHRLDSDNVTTIDIDPALTDAVRDRLAGLGYHPTIVTGDGYTGVPKGAPYDAVLATCAVTHVPPEWIRQLAPGGRLVAPLTGAHDAALMICTKTSADEVTGRFDAHRVSFMPLRADLANPLAGGGRLGVPATGMTHDGVSDVDPAQLLEPDDDLVLFLHMHIPGLTLGTAQHPRLGATVTVADATCLAEAALTPNPDKSWMVVQRGGHRLWDTVEHALNHWRKLDCPNRTRYGITALDDTSHQYVWLDHPDSERSWPMPL